MAGAAWIRRLGATALLCLLGPSGPRAAQDVDPPLRPIEKILRAPRAAGEFLVRFREEATADQRAAARGRIGARLERLLDVPAKDPRGPLHLLKLPAGADEAAALKQLTGDPAVLYAEPNYRVFKCDTQPDDPRFVDQWGLRNTGQSGGTPGADISAPSAWDLTTGSASVVVAVIDTGVDYAHPDLAANMWTNAGETAGNGVDDDGNGFVDDIHGWDFAGTGATSTAQDADPMDEEGHGTHVAGTIGAVGDNGIGVAGVAWSVRIMALRFLGPDGGFTSDAVAAYGYLLTMKSRGVDLVAVNNSWGGGGSSQSLFDAMQAAGNAGILNVCAAGNSGVNVDDFPHYPSSYDLPSILSVGASDRSEQAPLFSNFGADGVDLFAPGHQIVSTIPTAVTSGANTPGYDVYSGTSMAAPHVTGAAVLLAAHRPGLGVAEMRARLLYNVDKRDGYAGRAVTCGRLNARRALEDVDAVAPGAVSDLAAPSAEASYAAVQLAWTAPGDDGLSGQASAYEIRRSTTGITAANFASAERVPCPPLPLPAGSAQTHRVCGLQSSTTYFFAIRTYDNVGNASPVSSAVSVTTLPENAASVLFLEDFESGGFDGSRWATVQSPWAVRSNNGSNRARDSANTYANNADVSIITVPLNLSNRKDTTLSFVHRYAFEAGYDFGIVQVSTDGATWRRLSHYSATKAAYGAVDRLCLSAYDGFSSVRLRFRVLADFTVGDDGWWLDDIRVLSQSTVGNQAPVADAKSVSTPEDTAVGIALTGSDPDGDVITFAVASSPAHGSLTGAPPSLTYTPDANYAGPDSFTVTASDGSLTSASATVSITVTAVNDAPVADPQSVTTPEDTAVAVTLSGSDPEGSGLTFSIVSAPAHGTLSGGGANRTYTPAADYHGPDSFTFRANDGALNGAPATVSITVTAVNDAPGAVPQSVVVPEGGSAGITLSGVDPDGDPLTYVVVTPPSNGTLTGTAPNLTYTPAPGYAGSDGFTFRTADGTLQSAPAAVSITVSAVNDPPTADAQSVTTDEDTPKGITLSGGDPDGNPLAYAVVTGPAHGVLTGTPPNLTYTPSANYAGPDGFTFRTTDGALQSAPAAVTIAVTAVNDPPSGSPTAVVVDQGGTLLITLVASDPDGDPLTYQVTVPPGNGTLTGTGPDYVYTPAPGFTGQDSLTFTVSDGTSTGAPVVVTFAAPGPAGGGGGGGGSCGLLGVETILLLTLRFLRSRKRRA